MKRLKTLLIIFVLTISCVVSSYAVNHEASFAQSNQRINDLLGLDEKKEMDRLASDLEENLREIGEMDRLASDLEENLREFQEHSSIEQWSKNSEVSPTSIMHHTCGYGGTSCRTCYSKASTLGCGCVLQAYKCCCGAIMGGKKYYCPDHP